MSNRKCISFSPTASTRAPTFSSRLGIIRGTILSFIFYDQLNIAYVYTPHLHRYWSVLEKSISFDWHVVTIAAAKAAAVWLGVYRYSFLLPITYNMFACLWRHARRLRRRHGDYPAGIAGSLAPYNHNASAVTHLCLLQVYEKIWTANLLHLYNNPFEYLLDFSCKIMFKQ